MTYPSARVACFFLTILLELTLCAIFTHASPSDDNFGMNLLVALGSFCLAMPPLLLVGYLFNSSSKMKSMLMRANNTNQVKKIYKEMK